jgi:drug/metabolite transporter (DMT)-like permease
MAMEEGSAALTTSVVGMYPAIAAILGVVFLGEELKGNEILGVLLALASGAAFAAS